MNDPLDYIFISSAREMWLLDWRIFRDPWSTRKQRRVTRNRMKRNRRQAALERALAAANRRIETQARFIAGLEDQLKYMESLEHDSMLLAQWHERM